jgi:CubicO group peptidase (beta-lactamase class C family)
MTTRRISLFLGVLLMPLLSTALRPGWEPGVIATPVAAATALDSADRAWLESQLLLRGIPGLTVAVVTDGRVASVEAFGYSDALGRSAMAPEMLMEVASNSKLITALAALRAVREGTLNLDQPLRGYRPDFELEGPYADQVTLEMLLTHSSGLGNAIEGRPIAEQVPGEGFRYSGEGFELVGRLLAHSAGADVATALKTGVLEPLGIAAHTSYGQVDAPLKLASPHVSISFPLLLLTLLTVITFSLFSLLAWVIRKTGLMGRRPDSLSRWLLAASIAVALLVPFLFGTGDRVLRFLAVNLAFLLALIVITLGYQRWRAHQSLPAALVAAILTLIVGAAVVLRTPMPLKENVARFPAAAGLRASAGALGELLAVLVAPPPAWQADVREMTRPRIRVNAENQWGLGIGIQEIDGATSLWHWGINFPGYQSLLIGRPATRDGVVILMNGGPMSATLSGQRYAGLELARELAARILPGPHGAYWHGVQ